MMRVDEALLGCMTAASGAAADPERMILFGSRARGDAGADSDIALVVVEAEPFEPSRDRGAEETRLWRALAQFHVAKDILVYSRDEAERWRGDANHVLARAQREGRVPYYYLLHRGDFGLGEAHAGACILYALSCNLSARELSDRFAISSRSGRTLFDEPEDDGTGDEDEGGDAGAGGRGGKAKLLPWPPAQGQGAGPRRPGRPPRPADRPGAQADAALARRRRGKGECLYRRQRPRAPRPVRPAAASADRTGPGRLGRTRDPRILPLPPRQGALWLEGSP